MIRLGENMKTPFDPVLVNFNGEDLYCRPIEWNYDPHEYEDAEPSVLETTCPKCAQTVHIPCGILNRDSKSYYADCSMIANRPDGCSNPTFNTGLVYEYDPEAIDLGDKVDLASIDSNPDINLDEILDDILREESGQDDEDNTIEEKTAENVIDDQQFDMLDGLGDAVSFSDPIQDGLMSSEYLNKNE